MPRILSRWATRAGAAECYANCSVSSEAQKDGLVVVRVRVAIVLYDDASHRRGSLIGVGVAGSPAFLHVSLLRLAGDVGVARATTHRYGMSLKYLCFH